MSKLPSLYLESKLFHRPCRDVRDTSKKDPEKHRPISALTKIPQMHKATSAKPDMTGRLEGKFKISVEEMIKQLNKIISAEYSEWMRWFHYAIVLRGQWRDALAEEFYTHAEEELEHAKRLAMRVIVLGGYPATEMEHPKPLVKIEEIIAELIFREQEGIKLYREVLAQCGDNEGTRQILESNTEVEQGHLDELWRWYKSPDSMKKAGPYRTPEKPGQQIPYPWSETNWIEIPHHPKVNEPAHVTDHEGTVLHHYRDGTVRHPHNGAIYGSYNWTHDGQRHILRVKPAPGYEGMVHEGVGNPFKVSKAGADQESAGREEVSEGRRRQEYLHSYERVTPAGISGGAGPDLPERGRDWHGTVPGVPDEPQDGGDDEDDLDKKPQNLVKPIVPKFNQPAMKALAAAPRFSPGPFVSPPYKAWLMEQGYTEEEVDTGQYELSPRRRAEFNRFLTATIQKSISGLARFGGE